MLALTFLRRSGLNDDDLIEAYQISIRFSCTASRALKRPIRALQARPNGLRHAPPAPERFEAYPIVSSVAERLTQPVDFDKRFAFGLNALIAGIERRVGAA